MEWTGLHGLAPLISLMQKHMFLFFIFLMQTGWTGVVRVFEGNCANQRNKEAYIEPSNIASDSTIGCGLMD